MDTIASSTRYQYRCSIVAYAIMCLVLFMSVFMLSLYPALVVCDGNDDSMIAFAAITVDNQEIEGWEPDEIIQSDIGNNANGDGTATIESAPSRLMQSLTRLMSILLPLLIIVCAVIIIGNALRNIVVKPEDRVKIGDILKNMIVNFFWIFAAPIIVELIVFVVTNGEVIVFDALIGG